MNWIDEGALYSQIGLFLREDLGRGDITTQAIISRNTRARGRFVAGEDMIVAGLEAAEEVFLSLDPQQQLEAFISDGEPVTAGKVIARTAGFADVLIAGERVALNIMQRLSSVATLTSKFVKAVEGTSAQIVDTRATTPGLRILERYAVELGGGRNGRFGLDDGVLISSNHTALAGGIGAAVAKAKERLGHLHKIGVQVVDENEVTQALSAGADLLSFENLAVDKFCALCAIAKAGSTGVVIDFCGPETPEEAGRYAEAGADIISVPRLTISPPATKIIFQLQPA